MKNYHYHKQLEILWQKAVDQYNAGQRGSDTFFTPEELSFLESIGVTAQEIYDFAEDGSGGGDPDFLTFALITDVRRSYFLDKMKGQKTGKTVDPAGYPAKTAEIDGITWLPRIIEKAKTKLRGELDLDTMYGCGGDRRFLSESDIHPAEFLRFVADHEDDDSAIVDWVKSRREQTKM